MWLQLLQLQVADIVPSGDNVELQDTHTRYHDGGHVRLHGTQTFQSSAELLLRQLATSLGRSTITTDLCLAHFLDDLVDCAIACRIPKRTIPSHGLLVHVERNGLLCLLQRRRTGSLWLELDLVVVVHWSHTVGACLEPLHNMEVTNGSKRPWMEYGLLGDVGFGVEKLHKVNQIAVVLRVWWLGKQIGGSRDGW